MEHLNGRLALTIGGQKRHLYFDHTFSGIFFEQVPAEQMEAVLGSNPFRLPVLATYCALKSADDLNDLPDDFSERMVSRWLMDVSEADQTRIVALYEHSMGFMTRVLRNGTATGEKPAKTGLKASQ